MTNVLIATATYGNAMRPETRTSVQATVFAGKWRWYQSRHNPYPAPDRRNYLAQYEHIREKVLAEGYDAVLLVEHDMEIPPDALQKLWDTGAQVAYGVYLLRHGANVLNTYEYVGERNVGESLTFSPRKQAAARAQGVVQVSGVGFGCTLIRADVLERIPFRSNEKGSAAPDVPFAQDVLAAGIRSVAHFDVLCGHFQVYRMIMPFKDGVEPTQLVTALQAVNIMVNSQSYPLRVGEEYHLPISQVPDLVRVGYVQIQEVAKEGKGRIAIPASADKDIQRPPEDAAAQSDKPAGARRRRLAADATD